MTIEFSLNDEGDMKLVYIPATRCLKDKVSDLKTNNNKIIKLK